MKRYCYICGYETDEDIYECPQCLCEDVFVTSKDEEELMVLFDDRELTNAMIKLKQDNIVEYKLKLQQLKNSKEQQKVVEQKSTAQSNQRTCRFCGSTSFTPVKRKWSPLTGFLTNKTDLVCNNCGKKVQWIDM